MQRTGLLGMRVCVLKRLGFVSKMCLSDMDTFAVQDMLCFSLFILTFWGFGLQCTCIYSCHFDEEDILHVPREYLPLFFNTLDVCRSQDRAKPYK